MDEKTIKKVTNNVTVVMHEAEDMLQSILQVKGQDYCDLVRLLLISQSMRNTVRVASLALDDDPQEKILEAFTSQMLGFLSTAFSIMAVPREVVTEAMVDAENIEKTVSGLMDRAVSSAVDGKAFG